MATLIGAPQQNMMTDPAGGGDLFNGANKLFIKQEMAVIEACGIEAKQRYRISIPKGDNQEGDVFLYITEESDCCQRVCCSKNRALKLLVHAGNHKDGPVVQTMVKPFACGGPCPCLRPKFDVFGPSDVPIGSIDDPCKCCVMDQKVMDTGGSEMFTVSGGICQCGMCCPCCFPVIFDAKKGDQKVGEVQKLQLDCSEVFCKTNRFVVDFDKLTDPSERKMLLASAMLLDLEYFEENK